MLINVSNCTTNKGQKKQGNNKKNYLRSFKNIGILNCENPNIDVELKTFCLLGI